MSLFPPDLRSRFSQSVVGANKNRNNLKSWFGCRTCRRARLGVCCSTFRVHHPLGQEAHWQSREKQEKLWWEEKSVGDESSAKDQFLYDPGQTKLIPTLNFEQDIWKKVEMNWWRNLYWDGATLICPFTISNVFCSSLIRSVWKLHKVMLSLLLGLTLILPRPPGYGVFWTSVSNESLLFHRVLHVQHLMDGSILAPTALRWH